MTDFPQDPSSQPTEEELAAAYEEQLRQLRVEDVVLQAVVSMLNLGGRRAGLAPGTEGERDLDQLGLAVEGARRLLPLVEEQLGPDAAQLKDALSQLQMAYVRLGGTPPGGGAGGSGEPQQPAQPQRPATPPPPRIWTPGS
jgi:hypothetical protein